MNQASLAFTGSDFKRFKSIALKHCPTLYDEINTYQPEDYINRPEELTGFYKLNKEAQKKESESFFKQDFIVEYLEKSWIVQVYNQTCFFRLHDIYTGVNAKYEPWEITESDKLAIKKKMDIFYNKIISNEYHFKALNIDFKKFGYGRKSDNDKDAINDLNNGWEE